MPPARCPELGCFARLGSESLLYHKMSGRCAAKPMDRAPQPSKAKPRRKAAVKRKAPTGARIGRPARGEYPAPKPGNFAHGTATGYNYHECRCAECARWSRDTRRKNYVSRKAAA